jgi:DUF4097 and DUF4098 domain-containing protein YvlB
MATAEERMRILRMIQEGKITAEEGAKLISALQESRKGGERSSSAAAERRGSWLRVRVTDVLTGRAKVNVNLPLGLIDAGLKIGAQYAPQLEGFDVENLISQVKSGTSGKIIDVIDEEDGEHVEIFIE